MATPFTHSRAGRRDYTQSFRAVWDAGNWDVGGITLPQGESGEPGSGHYTDQAAAWVKDVSGRYRSTMLRCNALQPNANCCCLRTSAACCT